MFENRLNANKELANFDGVGGTSYSNQMSYNSEELRNMASYLREKSTVLYYEETMRFLSQLNQYWQGPDAEAFIAKVSELARRIDANKSTNYGLMASGLEFAANQLEETTSNLVSKINNL